MNPRLRGVIRLALLLAVALSLLFMFPRAVGFVEMASREIRYLWWLALLAALGVWLVWGMGRKPKQ